LGRSRFPWSLVSFARSPSPCPSLVGHEERTQTLTRESRADQSTLVNGLTPEDRSETFRRKQGLCRRNASRRTKRP
jgi:hypothetical protein